LVQTAARALMIKRENVDVTQSRGRESVTYH
jgi:hypothetical protein